MNADRYLIEKKFILVTLTILIITGLLWAGRLSSASYENMVIWLAGIFVLGEAASGWVQVLGIKAVAPRVTTLEKVSVNVDSNTQS